MPLTEPLADATVEALLKNVLQYGIVSFPSYALVAMDERGIDEVDVRNVLRFGTCAGHRWTRGSWRYEVCTDELVVVVAFRDEDSTVVVTAWWKGTPRRSQYGGAM